MLYIVGGLFGVTPKFVKQNVGYPIRFNTARSRENLGLQYRNFDDTTRDMVNQMHELKLV
jgi:hypothetical protein